MKSYYGDEHIVNFERYSQVLSQNFNVRIYLDGTRAETRQDSSIHLPNIKNMSSQELDCLYGILLHEIGHVLFTRLGNSQMKKINGREHFSIWNAVEDARIENKLITRLAGSNNIFEELYGVHFPKLAKKIFGLEFTDEADRWHLFCIHVHDYLLKTKRQYFNINNYSQKVKEEVLEIFNKAKPVIDSHKFSKAIDAFKLAGKLFKEFGPKNPKHLKEFKSVIGDLDKCKKELDNIYDSFKNNEHLSQLKKDKKELNVKRKQIQKIAERTGYAKKGREAEKALDSITDMIEYLAFIKESREIEQALLVLKEEIDAGLKKIQSLTETLDSERDSLRDMRKNKSTKELIDQQREVIRKNKQDIKSEKDAIKRIQRSIASFEKQSKVKQGNRNYYADLVKDNPFLNSTAEELDSKNNELSKVVDEARLGSNQVWNELSALKSEIKKLKNEIKKTNSDNKMKFKEALKKIEAKFDKHGLGGIDSIPRFEKNEDWSDSDVVQRQFDKKADDGSEKIVRNGMSKVSGERNILMTIDKIENNLQEIDLAKIFKKRLGLDELENYNDYLSEIRNTVEEADSNVALINRQYFAATTQFDVHRSELNPSNLNLMTLIKNKNSKVIRELASIFKVKLRNVKHIKFKPNQEEGIIDTRNVYKIPHNLDSNIFERPFVKPNDKVIATVAIDISGSMDKDYTAGGKKIQELAVILDTALSMAMIKHDVVGYGAPADRDVAALNASPELYTRTQHRLETITYRSLEGANGLGNIEIKCWDNANSESLRNIAYKLMRSRAKMKVIIHISDGKPFLHGAETGILDNDLKRTMIWLAENKIKLYSLGFNDYPKSLLTPNHLKINTYEQLVGFFRDML